MGSAGSGRTSEQSDFVVDAALEAGSLSPDRRRPLNSCSARKRSFEISRSIPSSEDAQRNNPYRRKGVARTTRTRPHQNMTPPSSGFLKTLQQRQGQAIKSTSDVQEL